MFTIAGKFFKGIGPKRSWVPDGAWSLITKATFAENYHHRAGNEPVELKLDAWTLSRAKSGKMARKGNTNHVRTLVHLNRISSNEQTWSGAKHLFAWLQGVPSGQSSPAQLWEVFQFLAQGEKKKKKTSSYETPGSSLLDLTQWKPHRKAICPGNVLLLQNKIQTAPRTCTGRLSHGLRSPTRHSAPQRLPSWRQSQSCLPELLLVRDH